MGDHVSFIAQDRRPRTVAPVDPERLHPKAKALLFLPDLVTDFLETTFRERISVACLDQTRRTDVADRDLDVSRGDPVVVRRSLIRGARSGRPLIHAVVHLAAARVPEALVSDLVTRTVGLGRLLEEYDVDRDREMLWYGREAAADSAADLTDTLESEELLVRGYRLVDEGLPLITIVERFSPDLFAG